MLDIKTIRENTEAVKSAAKHKSIEVDIDSLLSLDKQKRELQQQIDELRTKRNELSGKSKGGKPEPSDIEAGKKLKQQIAELESEFASVSDSLLEEQSRVPNLISDDTPIGGEEANKQIAEWGDTAKSDAIDHLQWLTDRKLVDFERGAKVSGSKFYYSMGALAELEMALIQYALMVCRKHGFTQIQVPNLVKEKVVDGAGFAPRGEESQIYGVEGEDLKLIATAEIPLTGLFMDEIINLDDGPQLFVAFSPCYRQEAGAYGKHSRGLYRNHQFYKVEMYVYCKPAESAEWHEKLRAIEEEIYQGLEIPYRVVINASADLGAPAFRKYDIEYYSAVDGEFRELSSCSNVTDYQARRMNVRYKNGDGETQMVHTLNGTAIVSSRGPIAIIENHQQSDGSVKLPAVLEPFMSQLVLQ